MPGSEFPFFVLERVKQAGSVEMVLERKCCPCVVVVLVRSSSPFEVWVLVDASSERVVVLTASAVEGITRDHLDSLVVVGVEPQFLTTTVAPAVVAWSSWLSLPMGVVLRQE